MPLKYEDYRQQQADELENEIDDAQEQHEEREQQAPENSFEIPERFRDKGPEDIIKSYMELEKAYSRQGNDLGKLRKLTDELLTLESGKSGNQQNHETQDEDKPLSIDDLYDDPEGAISRAVEKSAGKKLKDLEQQLAQERAKEVERDLNQTFDGWRDEVQTPEFANWLHEWATTPYRQAIAVAGDQGDPDAVREVLAAYYERKVNSERKQDDTRERRQQRRKEVQQGSLETGGNEPPPSDETFSRSQLMELRVQAKRGDPEARKYLAANSGAIAAAYAEGRIVD